MSPAAPGELGGALSWRGPLLLSWDAHHTGYYMRKKNKGRELSTETDDRVRLKSTSEKHFTEYISALCLSEWEGCACARPKGHDGLHWCGSVYNTCERWTDEQADEWWEIFKQDYMRD